MGAVDDILSGLNINQLAQILGTDEGTAQNAAAAAIPALLGGLQANASTPDGAQSLAGALGQHADSSATGADLDQIDTADGQKIVNHVLADDPQRLAGVSGLGGNLLAKLLPILAPIVLNYLAKQFLGGGTQATQAQAQPESSAGGLGDLLGGLLGGGSASSGNTLGDLLGGLLGGGGAATSQQDEGADLGSLLGQILGR